MGPLEKLFLHSHARSRVNLKSVLTAMTVNHAHAMIHFRLRGYGDELLSKMGFDLAQEHSLIDYLHGCNLSREERTWLEQYEAMVETSSVAYTDTVVVRDVYEYTVLILKNIWGTKPLNQN